MLSRYCALNTQERRALWSATWRLVLIRLSLLRGIEFTRQRFCGKLDCRAIPLKAEDLALWQLRAIALRRAGARIPGVHCLARSLALRWWMRSYRIDADCIIGVRSQASKLKSHAWVEVNGRAIDEQPEVVRLYQILKT